MENTVDLSFALLASQDNTGIEIVAQLNNNEPQIFAMGTQPVKINFAIDDSIETLHELKITMRGKTEAHTECDAQGNIVKDVVVSIVDDAMLLDSIDIFKLLWDLAEYTHDHNGTTELSQHKFYGVMGCNGTVSLKFSTPVYLWLLEHF